MVRKTAHPARFLPRRRRMLSAVGVAASVGLAAAGLIVASGGAQAASANLVQNPGFESGALSPWTCTGNNGSVVTNPVHSGSDALLATPTNSDDAQCSQTVSVQPSSSYTLTAWIEGSYVYLGDTGTGTSDTSVWTSSASWTQLSTSFSTGASTTSVTVWLHGWYGEGNYSVDDVSLAGPGGPTAPPSTTAAPTTAPPSTAPASPTANPTTPPSGGCTAAAWVSTTAYNGTAIVSYNGHQWTAKWWTQGDIPGNNAQAVWVDDGPCGTATSSPTATPTATPTNSPTANPTGGNPGTGKHVLTGYWQDFTNGATVQRLTDVNSAYDIIAVAFADADSTPGQITFSIDSGLSSALGGYTAAQFQADIATEHARGKKVILSVGGQDGTISVSDSASAANFASSAYSILKQYGFDGVDIDLENGVNATYMSQALHSLASMYGSGFVLTMAPQTIDVQSTGDDYFQLALDTKDILTIMNTQYYNSGSMLGCDGNVYSESTENFLVALACIQLEGGLNPSQVGLGVPASTSAAGSGYLSPSLVDNALDCLASGTNCGSFRPSQTWPGIGGAMTWSTNWDASNGNQIASVVGAHLHAMS